MSKKSLTIEQKIKQLEQNHKDQIKQLKKQKKELEQRENEEFGRLLRADFGIDTPEKYDSFKKRYAYLEHVYQRYGSSIERNEKERLERQKQNVSV